ncbi:MAG: TlpA family protein disulfide reductase [Deltaproteobacteria bacterium]|nr:TlpA family protein disulfide reductase [Deltaproteobacteria bacterium]
MARSVGMALTVVALLWGCRDEPSSAGRDGPPAPAIKLESLDHERFYLRDHRGKPVVLLFWDTSCVVCKRQMVELERMRKSLGPSRLVVASVLNDPENAAAARRMIAGLGLGFPALLDRGGKVAAAYRVGGFPTTVVVTPEGRLGLVREGYTEPLMKQLRTELERHLESAGDG